MAIDPQVQSNNGNTAASGIPYSTSNTATSDEKGAGLSYALKGDTAWAKIKRGLPKAAAATITAVSAVAILQGRGIDNPYAGTLPSATVYELAAKDNTFYAAYSITQQKNYEVKASLTVKKPNEAKNKLVDWYLYNAVEKNDGPDIISVAIDSKYLSEAMIFSITVSNGFDLTQSIYSKGFYLKDLPNEVPTISQESSSETSSR